MDNDSDDDDRDDQDLIYTSWRPPSIPPHKPTTLRARIFGTPSLRARDKAKCITTTPGLLGAGETETEADEPPRRLPTTRIIPASAPLVPPNTLQQRLTPLLFESSRLLSIVPAVIGTLYNIYQASHPPAPTFPDGRRAPERIDYIVSALWAILTGYQCLCLTTGLLTRWRLYYPPLPTLIRLLALQAICWPATHATLSVLEHDRRPVVTWAVVGTTTCASRAVQMWVTSNLWWERVVWEGGGGGGSGVGGAGGAGATAAAGIASAGSGVSSGSSGISSSSSSGGGGGSGSAGGGNVGEGGSGGYWKRWSGGAWGGRRWDWREVGVKCVLPAGVLYFVMAWAEALRREWSGC